MTCLKFWPVIRLCRKKKNSKKYQDNKFLARIRIVSNDNSHGTAQLTSQ